MWILDLILLTDNKMMLHGPKQSLAGIIQDNSYAIYNPCFFFCHYIKARVRSEGSWIKPVDLSFIFKIHTKTIQFTHIYL